MNKLVLNTDLTFQTVLEEQNKLSHFIANTPSPITLNLSEVQRSDSAGLALMIEALRIGHSANKAIYFEAIPKQMMSMMRFCNVLSLFTATI